MLSWEEKRKRKRLFTLLQVEYRGRNLWQMAEAKDISAYGMFIAAEKTEPPLTNVELMFELKKGDARKNIVAEGVVEWNRACPGKDDSGRILPAGMGIMFTRLIPAASKDFIKSALA